MRIKFDISKIVEGVLEALDRFAYGANDPMRSYEAHILRAEHPEEFKRVKRELKKNGKSSFVLKGRHYELFKDLK